jgi:ferritin-like protein
LVQDALPRIESASQERGHLVAHLSRGSLIKGSVAVVGALAGVAVGGAELAASADSSGSAATDRAILTYGLLMERLQAAFYAAALAGGQLTGEARQFAQVVGAQEQAHVKFLSAALGPSAGASPHFRFGDSATDPAKFIATAISLEETGLGVYNGQAVSLTPTTLAAAARIVSVEARHAAWARALDGEDPAPVAIDVPITVAQAKRTFKPFIVA